MVIQELVDDGAYIIRTYDIYSTIYSIDLSLNILYSHVWCVTPTFLYKSSIS